MLVPSETAMATMRDSALDEVAAADPDRPPCSPPSSTFSHPALVEREDRDEEKVYIVPYRWLLEAWEDNSSSPDTSASCRGILYSASSISSSYRGAMKLINNFFNSDLVFSLRREDNAEVASSCRSYALVRTDMWSQALRWHYESTMKSSESIFSVSKDNEGDTYALNMRISVAREADIMTVKISKKENSAENYKRASKIFNIDSEMVQIWDFSGQTTLIFMNERNKVHQNCHRNVDHENFLEIHVYGLIESLMSQNEPRRDDSSVQHLKRVPTHDGSFQSSSRTRDADSAYVSLNGYASCGALDSLGLTGLENLGNTCFMNSAVQCLAHTPMLVEYFLGDYSKEINTQNPLGMGGELASAFGELIRKLWAAEKVPVAPKNFKSTLARFAPQFSGFNQHDSQELLSFLLDGLHEDLNRVKKKRYVEVKDALDRPDEEVADEYWENHLARNNSIIVDICQGQYRSTLVCPLCKKISVTFDPFMYLLLPLPSTTTRTMTLTVFSCDGTTKPYQYSVTVPKNGKCRDIINSLSVACSLKEDETLLLAEVYNNRVIRYLDDLSDSISLVRDEDRLLAYRLVKDQRTGPLLVFMHQRMENGIDGKTAYHQFGIPLLSRLPTDLSKLDIKNLFQELTHPFLKKKEEADVNGEIDQSEADECSSFSGTGSDEELTFYVTDQKGQTMLSKIEPSDDGMINFDLHSSSSSSSSPSSSGVHVLVCWPDEILKCYDRHLLSSLPEVHQSGTSPRAPAQEESISLYACLEAFLKEEPLGPEDMWFCPGCKDHRQAIKKLDLWRIPEILVIHLKRFSYSRFMKNKLETLVDFPVRDLDISSYVARKNHKEDGESCRYSLFAISNHYGGMGGGHYTAFVQHAGQNQWYDFDDRSVLPMAEAGVKTSAAYVLFYRRVPSPDPNSLN